MGCCLSRSANPTQQPSKNPLHHPNPNSSRRNTNLRNPPPPPLEEETVKEVLTETPNVKATIDKEEEKKSLQIEESVELKQSAEIEVSEITVATENRSVATVSVSVSESVSAATVGGLEKRGGGDEVMSKSRDRADVSRRQRSTDRSPAKVLKRRPYSGEQTMTGPRDKRLRSPAKRALPSPEKKTNVAPRASRGRSQSPATSNPRNGINAGPARIRRDSGERSGRRSRSPASNIPRNRAGTLTEVNSKVNTGQRQHEEVRRTEGTVEEEEEACRRPADESLDNPLVSLECFIFL